MDNEQKSVPSIAPVIETIDDLYSKFNFKVFGGELEKPILTVSPNSKKGDRKYYGWFTTWRSWGTSNNELTSADQRVSTEKSDGYYEINVCAEYLSLPIEEIAGTLLHEMVHLYNKQRNVQDCSRGGYYHNKNFKEAAESHGLIVTKSRSHGYSQTCLNNEMKEYLDSLNIPDFSIYRRTLTSNMFRGEEDFPTYSCPNCKQTVFAAKEDKINLICGNCQMQLVLI